MTEMSFAEAIRYTLRMEMRADPSVFLIGLDIGGLGGIFKTTAGLLEEFGDERVMDAPLSESAIVGAAVGAAMMGLRPVVELLFADFFTIAMDQVVNHAAKIHYLSGGHFSVPLVIRAAFGYGAGAHHSQSAEPWLLNVPGLKIVIPSTPADACGLLMSSIRDNGPVIFLEHRKLYAMRGLVPIDDVTPIPIGTADIKRSGSDLTLIGTGAMVHRALAAAERVKQEDNIDVEVIDLRTVRPLDKKLILDSVTKTSRLMIVEETTGVGGVGSEVAAVAAQEALGYLDAPIRRISAPDTPIPVSNILLDHYVPSEERIVQAAREICL